MVATKADLDGEIAKVAASMTSLFDANRSAVDVLLSSKADKNVVDAKAEARAMEAVQDFFKSKIADLEAITAAATSADDLRRLRSDLERDFKRAMAAHFAKQKKLLGGGESDPATAVTRCLSCGHTTKAPPPGVVGPYASNAALRPRFQERRAVNRNPQILSDAADAAAASIMG